MTRVGFSIVAAFGLLLAGCDDARKTPAIDTDPSPILFEVTNQEGEVEGWLFGTMHSLPDDTDWRTATFESALDEADLLILEAADLDERAANAATFNRLAYSPGMPDILTRVGADDRVRLAELMDRGDFDSSDFANVETWAATLMLSGSIRFGKTENGVDRALLREFAGRPIEQLEGSEAQLQMFDALPEKEQRDMLAALLDDFERAKKDPARLTRIWLGGDLVAIENELERGMLADPELREALLEARNAAWIEKIAVWFEDEPQPIIAVGAAHLAGPGGLPALLAQRGYSVSRIQ